MQIGNAPPSQRTFRGLNELSYSSYTRSEAVESLIRRYLTAACSGRVSLAYTRLSQSGHWR